MTTLLLLDVAPNPVGGVNWGVLILLLVAILVLAVGFTTGLVFLLIRLKRRKLKEAEMEGQF